MKGRSLLYRVIENQSCIQVILRWKKIDSSVIVIVLYYTHFTLLGCVFICAIKLLRTLGSMFGITTDNELVIRAFY